MYFFVYRSWAITGELVSGRLQLLMLSGAKLPLLPRGGGGGGTPLYKRYRYVPSQTGRFLRRFGLKKGIDFAHFGLESGTVIERTTGMYERIYHFNSK